MTLQKGDTEDAVPFVRECGSLDLEADSLQQAARRGVGGAVCSQAIHLHDVAGLEFLDSMLQDGNVTAALDPAQMPQAAAAEAAALQAASDMPASSLRSHVLSDGDDAGSEEDAAAPGHRGPLAAGASRDAPAAQAGDSAALPAAPEQPPMAARFVTVLCVRQVCLFDSSAAEHLKSTRSPDRKIWRRDICSTMARNIIHMLRLLAGLASFRGAFCRSKPDGAGWPCDARCPDPSTARQQPRR